jgi:hypothetical protein
MNIIHSFHRTADEVEGWLSALVALACATRQLQHKVFEGNMLLRR